MREQMYQIELDSESRSILIPKAVTDAVGAVDDFGFLIHTDIPLICITRNNPVAKMEQKQPGKAGRPPKHRSNMEHWDESRNAFRFPIDNLYFHHGWEYYDHCMITGKLVNEETMIFELPESFSCETVDLSNFEVVPREMFSLKIDPELRRELRMWKKQRGNCDADS